MQQVSLRDYCQQASSLIQSGEPHKAIHITRYILRHYPRHVESYRVLGQALLTSGDPQAAAVQFRRVLGADPEDVTSRIGLAETHLAVGDPDKAIWHLQRAVDLSPGDSDLRARLGQLAEAHQGNGKPETLATTRAALGRVHARSGLNAKAAQEFRAVLEVHPDRTDVQTALAEVLWRTGDQLEAAQICQRILEKLPNALKANLMIGALWLYNQQPDEAEPYLKLARELDPENLVAQSLFGGASPLPYLEVNIEALDEEEIENVQPWPPPTSPEKRTSVSEIQEPAVDWMSELHEEGSTPMSDEERADEEFELPDWLKGVGDDLLGESDEQPAGSSPDEPDSEEGGETPAWLRELVARAEDSGAPEESAPEAEPGDVPDWLQELRPEVPEQTPAASEIPDWLASVAEDQPVYDIQPEPLPGSIEPEEPEVSPVMPELPGEPALAEDEGQVPLAELGTEEEPEAPAIPEAEVEVEELGAPDWLTEIQVGVTQPEPEAEVAIEEPETSLLEPVGDVVEDSDVPAWLRDITTGEPELSAEAEPISEAEPITEAPEPIPEAEVDDYGLPDWLREFEEPAAPDVVDTAEASVEAQPEPLEPADESLATADEGRALWEQILAEEGVDLASAEEAPPQEAVGMTAEEWLRSTAEVGEAPSTPEEPEPVAEVSELDWLEEGEEPVEEEAPPAAEVEVEPAQADVPDWLSQVTAGEPIPAEEVEPATDLPDWMRELQEAAADAESLAEAELPLEVEREEEAKEAVEVEVDEAGLPDWLREPAAEAGEFLEPEPEVSVETPEWLTELESEELLLAESDFEGPVELETGEMPEWLDEVMAGEPPLAEGWAVELEGAEAQEEDVPDWLREFRQLGEAPEPVGEVSEVEGLAETEIQEEFGEPPELPDWLLHLREGVAEAEVPPPGEELVVAEVEELPVVEEPPAVEEGLPELEVAEAEEIPAAEVVPAPEEAAEVLEPFEEPEPVEVPEPVEAPAPELLVTRELEVLGVEDLPEDPGARLSMARAALNTGDWSDALMIYETLVNSSEMLDSVIDNLEIGVSRHPDDSAGYQLLGDACMKDGRLGAALEAYRTALSKL